MKIRKLLYFPLLGLLALTSLFSCGEDRWKEYYPLTGRDLWMDSLVNNREPEISGRSALTAMRAVFASLRSSELGAAVEIPENR